MAYRLGEYVVYGELRNMRNYSTFGMIVLRGGEPGEETVIHIELTGNCSPDLQGKHFRFRPGEYDTTGPVFRRGEHSRFRDCQIGPTGTMTAHGWVRTFTCPVEEFIQRAKLGEPPPTTWKRRLYLEWFSQNGRVVIEMAGPVVEECVRAAKDENDEGEWIPLPNLAPVPDEEEMKRTHGLGVTIVRREEDGIHTEHWESRKKPDVSDDENESAPDALQRELDREAAAVERAIRGEREADDDVMREMELMDYCIDHSDGQPVHSLLEDFEDLPPPAELDDEEVEMRLKVLLSSLARIGVALDVCEHFTPRDCYALLREKILPKENVFGELAGTGWVQHMCTYEYCAECEAEFEAKYEEREKRDAGDKEP
ncbi:MAG: hypothetical protein HY706_03485 [Candidatus Hydrogenedentes bacterium]|nr:hypothetical protein [Candidatus Hydrogenedentota bacterium]